MKRIRWINDEDFIDCVALADFGSTLIYIMTFKKTETFYVEVMYLPEGKSSHVNIWPIKDQFTTQVAAKRAATAWWATVQDNKDFVKG